MKMHSYFTNHFINQTVIQFFSKSLGHPLNSITEYSSNNDKVFCSYGILRGTGEIFKNSSNFIYIDHGYFSSSSRKFNSNKQTIIKELDGYFRVVFNDIYFNQNFMNYDSKRFDKLSIKVKDLNKSNEYIIVSEPTENTLNFLELPNWLDETLAEVKKFTDRKIIVHNKFSKIPLKELLKKAHAFVSCQSTAGYMSIIEGVPAYFTHKSLSKYGNIDQIEKQNLNHDLLYLAANSQWKLKEFFSDDFKTYVKNLLN